MRYSPVRHSTPGASSIVSVRLACVKHAASVQSEPESNSSVHSFPNCITVSQIISVRMFVFISLPTGQPSRQIYGNKTPAQTIFSLVKDPDTKAFKRPVHRGKAAHYSCQSLPCKQFRKYFTKFFVNCCFRRKLFAKNLRFSVWSG